MTSFFDIKDLSKKDLERIIDDSIDIKKNGCSKILKNKNVLIVDDSIVRGTTSKEIVQMAKDAGANKVFFTSMYFTCSNTWLA